MGLLILLFYTTAADGQHTGELESLHNLLLSYASKRIDYEPDSYNARIQLALEDHNENCKRKPKLGESFEFRFKGKN